MAPDLTSSNSAIDDLGKEARAFCPEMECGL
jgi:hypothetical protein